jgi:uncharacterized protein YecE (DUF72 family)
MTTKSGQIRVGIGGWTFEPWRGVFYPDKWPKAKELDYAGQHLTGIEINGTFYSSQKPASFIKWRDAVPEGFVFALKANRFCVNRRVLAEAGESIGRFVNQGIAELGPKLGPILWQLAATKKFDAEDMAAFLALMPREQDGIRLRHAIEPRHESFKCREFVAMARAANIAIVIAEHDSYPQIADLSADFVYARLQCAREEEPEGYGPAALDRWAKVARGWAAGKSPAGLDYVSDAPGEARPRDVFAFFISGYKERNPLAAQSLRARLG